MGVCCTGRTSKEEEFIQTVFLDMTFAHYGVEEFDKICKEFEHEEEGISQTFLKTYFRPKLYNTYPNYQYFDIHENFFESLYHEIQIEGTYDIAFLLYPLMDKSSYDTSEIIPQFYTIFCKVSSHIQNKTVLDFIKAMEEFMYVNIILPTEVVYKSIYKENQKYRIEYLYRNIFTVDNYNKFVVHTLGKYKKQKNIRDELITFGFFTEFFTDNFFFLDFFDLRSMFYEFYYDQINS